MSILKRGENMTRFIVCVTDFNYTNLEIEKKVLAKWGAEVRGFHCTSSEEVIDVAQDADAIISQYAPITAEVIASLRKCRAIGRYGIGVDNIDVEAATTRGIAVINVPSYCEDEVSDHALALLLAWARRVVHYTNEIRNNIWDWKTGRPIPRLQGKVLGLLGFGKIARHLARKAQALGMKIISHDPYIPPEEMRKLNVEPVTFEDLLKRSDFLSVHVPLTEGTQHLIDAKALSLMKPTACLINTSRGGVVDEHALIEALQQARLAGACLDVLEKEPPSPDNPLLKMPQVLLSPHVAWYSEESETELRRKVATDIGRALNGFLPEGLVNRELAQRFKRI
ncbi:C-terminal binding protein [Candidatus Bipolaricaulota sp. J31]